MIRTNAMLLKLGALLLTVDALAVAGAAGQTKAGQTKKVEVVNTPTVTVANTPSVNVKSLPAVQLAPGATVGIAGIPTVHVDSTANNPLPVHDPATPARTPIQLTFQITVEDGVSGGNGADGGPDGGVFVHRERAGLDLRRSIEPGVVERDGILLREPGIVDADVVDGAVKVWGRGNGGVADFDGGLPIEIRLALGPPTKREPPDQ